jgi:hypothetical protein
MKTKGSAWSPWHAAGSPIPTGDREHQLSFSMVVGTAIALAINGLAIPCSAWAEHEHVAIGREALRRLEHEHGAEYKVLEDAWRAWRERDADLTNDRLEPLLCSHMAESGRCIGFATLPMAAGDHACTPDDLFVNMRQDWYFDLMDVVEDANADLDDLKRSVHGDDVEDLGPRRLEIRRVLDVQLQVADPDYISRASNNRGHFAIPLNSVQQNLQTYVRRVLPREPGPSVRQNPIGLYLHFHIRALYFATQAFGHPENAYEHRMAFLHEAFALHFLQDIFSAGHMFGAPESDALRFGTHDDLSENGLNATTWGGQPFFAHGDAFLLDEDLKWSSAAVLASMRQFASAFAGPATDLGGLKPSAWEALSEHPPEVLDGIDTCHGDEILAHHGAINFSAEESAALDSALMDVLRVTPRPQTGPEPWTAGANDGFASVRTVRTSYGPFVPLLVELSGALDFYTNKEIEEGFTISPEVHLGLGVGYSGEGVMSKYYDALLYVAPMVMLGGEDYPLDDHERRRPYVGNVGVGFRLRLPYAYVPGDIVLYGPLAGAGQTAGFKMAQRAFAGGTFGSYAVFFIGPARVRMDIGREIQLMWRFRTSRDRAAADDQRTNPYAGWDLTLPLISTRILQGTSGRLGAETDLRLGLRLGERTVDDDDDPNLRGFYIGGVISLDNLASIYLE